MRSPACFGQVSVQGGAGQSAAGGGVRPLWERSSARSVTPYR